MLDFKISYGDQYAGESSNKIQHQIQNQGCKCSLCQRLILQKMKIIKNDIPPELQEQLGIKIQRQSYYIKYLTNFYTYDKLSRKIRIVIPQICVFEKGVPIYLMSKKKQQYNFRLIKNKQKLNFYQIKNFFHEGYLYHNKFHQSSQNNNKLKTKPSATYQVKTKEMLKNQCMVIGRFTNNPGQILTPNMMDNLFKHNKKQFRTNLLYMQTLVSSKTYQQIRIKVKISQVLKQYSFIRAKNQIQMIVNEIKPTQYDYVSQREQVQYEDQLKRQNWKQYLQYLSLKLILLYSFKTDVLIEQCIFKFVKGSPETYYFVDLQVNQFGNKQLVWGIGQQQKLNKKIQTQKAINLEQDDNVFPQQKIISQVRTKPIFSSYQGSRNIGIQNERMNTKKGEVYSQIRRPQSTKIRKSFNIRKTTILGVNKYLLN